MPYVQREGSEIIAVFRDSCEQAHEHIEIDAPELLVFLAGKEPGSLAKVELMHSDLSMGRVVEDLIEVLMEKNVIAITDLPLEVIQKLNNRRGVRSQLSVFDRIFGPDNWD